MKKLEEDEKQIRIVLAEYEEMVRQENLHLDNPHGSTDQYNLLALPDCTENSSTEQIPANPASPAPESIPGGLAAEKCNQ